jgi:hypothetical protein
LDNPVYEPDEEHATALVLNAKERMDPAWSMQPATVLMANAARNRSSEIRSAACLEKSQKKRRRELTLHARLGRQDKASCLAAGTSFLSFCLHIVFARLGLSR